MWTQSTSVTDRQTDRITITNTVQRIASHGNNVEAALKHFQMAVPRPFISIIMFSSPRLAICFPIRVASLHDLFFLPHLFTHV